MLHTALSLFSPTLGFALLASVAPPEWAPPLGASAIITTFVGWLMFRMEKRFDAFTQRMGHLAAANYMSVINSRYADAALKADATRNLQKMKDGEPPDSG